MPFLTPSLLIASGKGGVGKSTVSVNLAIALAEKGLKVGLLDADMYGPSIPVMLGLQRTISPEAPVEKFGIKTLSAGFFLQEGKAGLWRGPILHGLLEKLLAAPWGELDLLVVDLPPGTGDVPISLSKLLANRKGIVVTTPQEVALQDAMRAMQAFETLEIETFGVIENMAGFSPSPGAPPIHLFGRGGGALLANRFNVPLLGSIPFLPSLQYGGDEGRPPAFFKGSDGSHQSYERLASTLLYALKVGKGS